MPRYGYGFTSSARSIKKRGDLKLKLSDLDSAEKVWVQAGGSFVGDFEDGVRGKNAKGPYLSSLVASANTTDVTFHGPNQPDEPLDRLFSSLRRVSVDSRVNASPEPGRGDDEQVVGTSVQFRNFGGDLFSSKLNSVHAKANATAEVVFDNNRQQDANGQDLDVWGDGYMRSLRTIRVTSRDENALVNISNDGGNDFMANLQSISIQAKERAELIISASVEATTLPDGSLGNGFMRSLKSISIVSEEEVAHASISYSGNGTEYMANLESIYLSGGNAAGFVQTVADLSLSISPDFEGTETIVMLPSLKTIAVVASGGAASISISVEGDLELMSSLEHITVKGADSRRNASLSISHAVAVEDQDVGSFMSSLKSITVIGENAGASFAISVESEASYFASLEEINVEGDGTSNVAIRNATADDFMPLLSALDVSMTEVREDYTLVPQAVIDLDNSLRVGDFGDTPGDGFMAGLRTVELGSIGSAELALQNGRLILVNDPISTVGGQNFLSAL